MKLWQKDTQINKQIENFTVGRDRELDLWLAEYDILGSLAHIEMLESINLLEKEELTQLQKELKKLYKKIGPWEKTHVARHALRPHYSEYVEGLISDYTPLSGDRKFGDDHALLGGLGKVRGRSVMVMGHEKGTDTETRLKHNFGMAQPEGYRKAVRLMDMAERFNLPVISFAAAPKNAAKPRR